MASEFGLTETKFDPSVADGQYRKTMANTILRSYLPNFKFTSLEEGVKATVLAFK